MADPYKRDRRLGRWTVDVRRSSVDDAAALLIQRDVIIRGTQYDAINGWIEWLGQSEHFEIVPDGCVVPLYVPSVHVVNNEPRAVTWRRAGDGGSAI